MPEPFFGSDGISIFDFLSRWAFHMIADGVTINVKIVAKVNPQMIVNASCCHHIVDGSLNVTWRVKKLMDNELAMGIKPSTVVRVVRNTGRKRCAPV